MPAAERRYLAEVHEGKEYFTLDLEGLWGELTEYRKKHGIKPITSFSIPVASAAIWHPNWREEFGSSPPNQTPFDIDFHEYRDVAGDQGNGFSNVFEGLVMLASDIDALCKSNANFPKDEWLK